MAKETSVDAAAPVEVTTKSVESIKQDVALADKIIKQVEYYFSDVNMSKDKFMQEEIQKDSGWVDLEVLTKFNRLKILSTDYKVIINALKKSDSNLLEIDEEKNRIRRAKPLPENLSEFETSLKQNTVYVKGFPATISLDDLYAFFEPYGKVLQIFMRRFPSTRQFKGSLFVTFETQDQMQSFMDLNEVKHEETVLQRETQEAYLQRKGPQLDAAKSAKLKREQEKEDKKKQREEAEQAFYKSQVVLGSVLHLKGLGSGATREIIRELFDSHAKIRWIDFNKGDPEAYVRFQEENKAQLALDAALKANNDELKIKDEKFEYRILEGEEEQQFWKDTIKKLIEQKSKGRKGKKSGFGGGNKNKNFKNKNKRSFKDNDGDDDDEDGGSAEGGSAGEEDVESTKAIKKQKV